MYLCFSVLSNDLLLVLRFLFTISMPGPCTKWTISAEHTVHEELTIGEVCHCNCDSSTQNYNIKMARFGLLAVTFTVAIATLSFDEGLWPMNIMQITVLKYIIETLNGHMNLISNWNLSIRIRKQLQLSIGIK